MSYKTLTESCYYKTGRDGVVFEALDNIAPNLFDNNNNIDNSILSKFSKFRFTIIDSRKGKGRALYYNVDPNEMILLNYLWSDGIPSILKKRLGAYNDLSGLEQVEIRNLIESFSSIDYTRFDRLFDYSTKKESNSLTLQKNILDYNSAKKDKLIVKRITLSFEEEMRSSSKFKITIEDGEAIKDTSKGSGLNIVKNGTYKTIDKTHLMLTRGEFMIPIAEGAKRVMLANQGFYSQMKMAEKDFTNRKFESKDFEGDNIDTWNPQGKSKFKVEKQKKSEVVNEKVKKIVEVEEIEEVETKVNNCDDCNAVIDDNVYNYTTKTYKRALCFNCQKKEKEKDTGKNCSGCGKSIDNNVFNYSNKIYKKPLCIYCQKKQ